MILINKLKQRVKLLKEEIVPIYYSLFDRRTPILTKFVALSAVGYLLSPIDLIPDFIPVLGLLDDLIIVPLLIILAVKLIPDVVLKDIKSKVDKSEKLNKKWYYAVPVVIIYLLLFIWLFKTLIFPHFFT